MVTNYDPPATLLLRYENVFYYVLCKTLKGTLKESWHFSVPSVIHESKIRAQ
jgi:hypothetical protein